MQEPNEAEFHDRVRQALGTYRPEPRPEDWARMRRALRRRQWWRLGVVGLLCVLSGLLAGKWLADTESHEIAAGVATGTPPAAAPVPPASGNSGTVSAPRAESAPFLDKSGL